MRIGAQVTTVSEQLGQEKLQLVLSLLTTAGEIGLKTDELAEAITQITDAE